MYVYSKFYSFVNLQESYWLVKVNLYDDMRDWTFIRDNRGMYRDSYTYLCIELYIKINRYTLYVLDINLDFTLIIGGMSYWRRRTFHYHNRWSSVNGPAQM